MHPFRDKNPKHTKNRRVCKNYTSYKKTLRKDFFNRCGYCNDSDLNARRSYVIDHFVPQNPEGFTHTILSNDYYNLIYSCSFCNGKKSNKWPTNDVNIHNNGTVGFISPTKKAYAQLFEREANGYIIIKNNSRIGKHIFDELNLGWALHALNWKFERFMDQEKILNDFYSKTNDSAIRASIDALKVSRTSITDDINKLING